MNKKQFALFFLENDLDDTFINFFCREIYFQPSYREETFDFYNKTHTFLSVSISLGKYQTSFFLINLGLNLRYEIPETGENLLSLAFSSGNKTLFCDLLEYMMYNDPEWFQMKTGCNLSQGALLSYIQNLFYPNLEE